MGRFFVFSHCGMCLLAVTILKKRVQCGHCFVYNFRLSLNGEDDEGRGVLRVFTLLTCRGCHLQLISPIDGRAAVAPAPFIGSSSPRGMSFSAARSFLRGPTAFKVPDLLSLVLFF